MAAGLPVLSPASPEPRSSPTPQVSPRSDTWDGDHGSYQGPVEGWMQRSPHGSLGHPRAGTEAMLGDNLCGCVLTSAFSFWAKVIKAGDS